VLGFYIDQVWVDTQEFTIAIVDLIIKCLKEVSLEH
jgi:hypothetical protein